MNQSLANPNPDLTQLCLFTYAPEVFTALVLLSLTLLTVFSRVHSFIHQANVYLMPGTEDIRVNEITKINNCPVILYLPVKEADHKKNT